MPLDLDPRRTALVLIDLQSGILSMPVAPYSAADVIRNAVTLAQAVAAVGAPLVNVAFAPDRADRLKQPVDVPPPIPATALPSDWSDLAQDIAALPIAVRITKRQWSAFYGTELDLQLRRRGVTTIVLGGISTNFGVESTARDAWQHNYAVVVAEDACTSSAAELHRFAIDRILPRISRVRSTAEIVAALSQAAGVA